MSEFAPHFLEAEGGPVEIRKMAQGDEAAVLAFARALPAHDLLFLPRDITQEKVLKAWILELEAGGMVSLLAARDGVVLGCGALARDPHSWSPHVAEVRVVVSSAARGLGVGRALMHDCYQMALAAGARKLVAHMTADQKGAISLFEGIGFKAEALLRDHVQDREGARHDIVVLAHDVERFAAQLDVFGMRG